MEAISVTLDTVLAEDGDTADDPYNAADGSVRSPAYLENIGRFCPIDKATGKDDYTPPEMDGSPVTDWRYAFATDLYNYLATRTPQDDWLANVAPEIVPGSNDQGAIWTPSKAVPNGPITSDAQANRGNEDGVGEHGKININTASARVLATIPMVTDPATGQINLAANTALAMAIVNHRNTKGPFRSIVDLMKVQNFKTSLRGVNDFPLPYAGTIDPNNGDGDLSPYGTGAGDNMVDFENNFAVFTRISNLITTRSDSFTVYIVVQGWRNVGTTMPELVVQRRAAYFADRATVRPVVSGAAGPNPLPRTQMGVINIPNN